MNHNNTKDTATYDGYRWGIHTYTLSLKGKGEMATYTITRKNLQENKWGKPVEASAADIKENDDFKLAGTIVDFPANLASLSCIDWTFNKALGWPDENSIYVRQREIKEEIDGKALTVTYWALKDASNPMDLLVGSNNEVIAAKKELGLIQ